MIATLLVVALAMVAQDLLGTALVVAEARGLAWWAGGLDAAGDVASRVGTAVTAGLYAQSGWSTRTLAALAVTCAASLVATAQGTRLAHRILPPEASHG